MAHRGGVDVRVAVAVAADPAAHLQVVGVAQVQRGAAVAVRDLALDPGYLSRLRSGQMSDPGEDLLKRLGLKRVVTYQRTRAKK